MNRTQWLALALAVAPAVAHAQEDTPAPAQTVDVSAAPSAAEAVDVSAAPESAGHASSLDARNGKVAGVGLRLGTIVSVISGAAIDAYWVQSPSLQIGLFVGGGKVDLKKAVEDKADKTSSTETKKADLTGSLAMVQARWFAGNTFNLTAGLGSRRIKLEYDVEDKGGAAGIKGKVEATVPVLHVALGNLWAWDNGFYLGADWFALSIPLGKKDPKVERVTRGGAASADLNEVDKDAKDLGKTFAKVTSFQLALFHIGWMF